MVCSGNAETRTVCPARALAVQKFVYDQPFGSKTDQLLNGEAGEVAEFGGGFNTGEYIFWLEHG